MDKHEITNQLGWGQRFFEYTLYYLDLLKELEKGGRHQRKESNTTTKPGLDLLPPDVWMFWATRFQL